MVEYGNLKEIAEHYDIRSDIAFNLIHDGYDTIEKIDGASDECLLRVAKVGPAVLKALRGDNTLNAKWRRQRWYSLEPGVDVKKREEPVYTENGIEYSMCIDCSHAIYTDVQASVGWEPYPDCKLEGTNFCWCSINCCLVHQQQVPCPVFRERSEDDYKVVAEPKRELLADFVTTEYRIDQRGLDYLSEIDATQSDDDFALVFNVTSENAAKLLGNRLHAKVWAEEPLCQ